MSSRLMTFYLRSVAAIAPFFRSFGELYEMPSRTALPGDMEFICECIVEIL